MKIGEGVVLFNEQPEQGWLNGRVKHTHTQDRERRPREHFMCTGIRQSEIGF